MPDRSTGEQPRRIEFDAIGTGDAFDDQLRQIGVIGVVVLLLGAIVFLLRAARNATDGGRQVLVDVGNLKCHQRERRGILSTLSPTVARVVRGVYQSRTNRRVDRLTNTTELADGIVGRSAWPTTT